MIQDNIQINPYRITNGLYRSSNSDGNNGAFLIPGPRSIKLVVIASDGSGWEHVSIHRLNKNNCPYWDEMCYIKDLFWQPEETVIQYHPPKSQYVNMHPTTLHLWKPINIEIPIPPSILVGI